MLEEVKQDTAAGLHARKEANLPVHTVEIGLLNTPVRRMAPFWVSFDYQIRRMAAVVIHFLLCPFPFAANVYLYARTHALFSFWDHALQEVERRL